MRYIYITCNNFQDDNIRELLVLCHGLHVNIHLMTILILYEKNLCNCL